jgi:hypothetical protein
MGATGCVTVCGAYPTLCQEHAVEPNAQRMVCCGSPGSAREALPQEGLCVQALLRGAVSAVVPAGMQN